MLISPTMGATTADLRALVEGHEPASSREAAAKLRFLEELSGLSAPCDEGFRLGPHARWPHGGRLMICDRPGSIVVPDEG